MKNIILKSVMAAIVIFGSIQFINAQTETEQQKKELKKRREMAKEVIGRDGEENLNTLEREADVGEDPCALKDTPEWYAMSNQQDGRRGDPNLASALLRRNKQDLMEKIGGALKRVTRDYFDQMDIDNQSTVASHIQGTGELVVDRILNDVMEYCRKTSNPDDRGNIIMYMSIRVSKKDVVDKIVKEISEDKQLKVRFNEEKFRESAKKYFE